jgi:hypothetical protein
MVEYGRQKKDPLLATNNFSQKQTNTQPSFTQHSIQVGIAHERDKIRRIYAMLFKILSQCAQVMAGIKGLHPRKEELKR